MESNSHTSRSHANGILASPKDISVIIQGDIRYDTEACIASVKRFLPQAELILSTYEGEKIPEGFTGRVVRVHDPGTQVPVTRNLKAPASNINRQIATSRAGLAIATRPFSLKLRSDALLVSDQMFIVWNAVARADPGASRLIVPSFFSRNPLGISGYLFHASDWIMFGRSERMRSYWDIPFVSNTATTWFDDHRHRLLSTPTARRMRSRFTPEQHLTISFAQSLGYKTPIFFNDRSFALIRECERFYAQEMVIASPNDLGVALPKYTALTRRPFQWVDNILFEDWYRMYRRHVSSSPFGIRELRRNWAQLMMRRAVFLPLFATRHILSASALYALWRRRLKAKRATTSLF